MINYNILRKEKDLFVIAIGLLIAMITYISYYFDFFLNNNLCIYIVDFCVFLSILFSLKDFKNRYIMLCFNALFFLFLLSGINVCLILNKPISSYLDANKITTSFTCHAILMSNLTINIVLYYLYTKNTKTKKRIDFSNLRKSNNKFNIHIITKKIIFIFFIFILLGKIIGAFIQYRFVENNSYVDLYVNSVSKPFIITSCESIFYFVLFLWLATCPSKRNFFPIIILVFFAEVLILFSGDRTEPAAFLLVLIFYMYLRSKTEKNFIKFKKTYVVLLIVLLPLFIYLMQLVSFSRNHADLEITNNFIFDFFSKQGSSVQIISNGYYLKEKISSLAGNNFIFGPIKFYLEQNFIVRKIFGIEQINGNSVESALLGSSYGSTMAYIRYRVSYLNGVGGGSSYIAELYHDGGWNLLVLGNVILAIVLKKISSFVLNSKNVYLKTFSYLAFYNIIIISRTNSMGWLVKVFSIQNIVILLFILLIDMSVNGVGEKNENRNYYNTYGG